MQDDDALVQITMLPGVVAFRRGGFEGEDDAAQGFRERRLVRGWVFCRWGRGRVWEGGVPVDEPAVHGVQWGEGGFVEFFPGVPGVVDPR